MNVLVIYAHPSNSSFTFQVLENLKQGLADGGHHIQVSDLYQMDFQSDMSIEEYNREGFVDTRLAIPVDVRKEQEKIEKADCIFFVYPVWWSDCPAKMKGWFDRVYTVGYAYSHDENTAKTELMKTLDAGVVICTAGHPNTLLEDSGIAESMRKVMLDDRLGDRFTNKEMIILGGTMDLEEVKEKHLDKVYEIGKRIAHHFK